MVDVIKRLRSLDSDEVNQALDKGWNPSMNELYTDFIDYVSGSDSGGSVEAARDLVTIADDEDEESQWEGIYETDSPKRQQSTGCNLNSIRSYFQKKFRQGGNDNARR